MNIYIFPHTEIISRFGEWNDFMFSDMNEKEELPDEVYDLIEYAKENDLVFTEYNFMLCFNMQDSQTHHGDYTMFIPDPKFNI